MKLNMSNPQMIVNDTDGPNFTDCPRVKFAGSSGNDRYMFIGWPWVDGRKSSVVSSTARLTC